MIRTLDDLQDELDDDLAWRRVELAAYLKAVRTATGPAQDALCRGAVPLLYAHWEGYTKGALAGYLTYVGRRKLRLQELRPALAGLAVEHMMQSIENVRGDAMVPRRATMLIEGLEERAQLPWRQGVDTKSNLSVGRCRALFESLALDAALLDTKMPVVDYQLLRPRNEIAHGRWMGIDLTGVEHLHKEVVGLIGLVKNVVLNAATMGEYRS